jgi:hypothetical protein
LSRGKGQEVEAEQKGGIPQMAAWYIIWPQFIPVIIFIKRRENMMCKYFGTVCFLIFMGACAFDLAHVSYKQTLLIPNSEGRINFIMKDAVKIEQAPCGYERTLLKGTRWELIGKIPEGDVYKTRDQVLTVECSHVYEAFLVISDRILKGFYLPVEKGFAPISPTIKLPID